MDKLVRSASIFRNLLIVVYALSKSISVSLLFYQIRQ